MHKVTTLTEWLEDNNVTMEATWGSDDPTPKTFEHTDAWTCEFKYQDRAINITFYMGLGYNGELPDILRVITCILDDSASVDNCSCFEEWADCYGWNPDSREAERVYNACKVNADKIAYLFGDKYSEVIDLYLDSDE